MVTIRSETGYSLLEVVISAALGTIVLAGALDVYVSSTKSLLRQANGVQMQADAKAAMDYMVREVRIAVPAFFLTITPSEPGNTIKFARVEESGSASSGTLTTLSDTSRNWAVNRFASTAGGTSYFVRILPGLPGSGAGHRISTNTATTLTLAGTDPGFPTAPTNTSLYSIYRIKTFTLVNGTLQYDTGGAPHLLAKNVTRLAFSATTTIACDAAGTTFPSLGTICISLTTQSAAPDPVTGLNRLTGRVPGKYSLTSIARPRN